MSFFNDTNLKRVAKIMETLDLISKSGNANGADREHFQDLLEPVIQAMAELSPSVGHPSEIEEQPKKEVDPNRRHPLSCGDKNTAPRWVDVRDMALNASLQELSAAMIVYLDRIDTEIHNRSI